MRGAPWVRKIVGLQHGADANRKRRAVGAGGRWPAPGSTIAALPREEPPMAMTAKILHVDLTNRTTRTEDIPEATYRKYLGGGALAAHILLRDMKPGAEPFGPDNVLVFMTSVINGLSLSGTNRYTAAAKSPLTVDYINSVTGWNMSIYELMKVTGLM